MKITRRKSQIEAGKGAPKASMTLTVGWNGKRLTRLSAADCPTIPISSGLPRFDKKKSRIPTNMPTGQEKFRLWHPFWYFSKIVIILTLQEHEIDYTLESNHKSDEQFTERSWQKLSSLKISKFSGGAFPQNLVKRPKRRPSWLKN